MKKIIMALLLAWLLLSCCAALAAESDFVFEVSGESATLKSYTGSASSVTVPGWYHGRPVTAIGSGAFANNSSITSVRLPSSIQRIGSGAFRSCTSLSSMSSYAAAQPEGDPHTWDAGVITTQPTADTEGVKTFTCSGCGDTRTEAVPATGGGGSRVPGDASGDGIINNRDVLRLMKYLAGAESNIDVSNADVTGDGIVNNRDVLRLMKHLADPSVKLN